MKEISEQVAEGRVVPQADAVLEMYGAIEALASCNGVQTLRQKYEASVRGLSSMEAEMRALGKSAEEMARTLHAERRALGVQFKDLTPPAQRELIYQRNLEKYGDPLGPSIEWLREHGKSWEDIIEGAVRPGGKDIIPKVIKSAERWWRECAPIAISRQIRQRCRPRPRHWVFQTVLKS